MKINIQNIDTYLMSYIDNELSLAEINELELFIKAHPVYEKELALLKQTVLEADEIEYEDKQLLYRYSEMEAPLPSAIKKQLYRQEAKVVEGFFTRTKIISISSIAALLLLFIGYRFYTSGNDLNNASFSQRKKANIENSTEAVIANKEQVNNSDIGTLANTEQDLEISKLAKHKNFASLAPENIIYTTKNTVIGKKSSLNIVNKALTVNNNQASNKIAFGSNEQYVAAATISETDITPNSITAELTNKTIAEIEPINNTENTKQAIANTNTPLEEKENYENIDTDDHDRTIYIANLEIDGDKLRGFSRRINAIFKRNKNEKQK
jgi:hypothetical protein